MAVPWLRIFDAVLGVTDLVILRKTTRQQEAATGRDAAGSLEQPGAGNLEARLAGVVVAALKEAFERDNRRLDLERERAEAERLRAERALRLELRRQAVDREIGRLRLIGGLAVASWLGSLLLWTRLAAAAGSGMRIAFGAGWVLLLAALAIALGQTGVVSRSALDDIDHEPRGSSVPGALAAWLLVLGLGFVGVAALLT